MKILITGASGFFGKSLISSLEQSTEDFQCFCIYKKNAVHSSNNKFQWVQCDLLNADETEQLIKNIKPTRLVHLAWHVTPQQFWTAFENITWLHASINLFQAFCENGGKMFIGAGTLAEYDWTKGILDEKKTPLTPSTLYGQCKKSLHEIVTSIRNTHYQQTKIIWPRIGYFFGENEPEEKLFSKLIYNIKNGLATNLASPEFSRPYEHIKYFGEAISKLLMVKTLDDITFNMSASTSHALKEIVDFIQKNFEKKFTGLNYNAYPSIPISLPVETAILKKELGFNTPDTFFEDLQTMVVGRK